MPSAGNFMPHWLDVGSGEYFVRQTTTVHLQVCTPCPRQLMVNCLLFNVLTVIGLKVCELTELCAG